MQEIKQPDAKDGWDDVEVITADDVGSLSDLIELPVEVLDEVSGGAGNAAIDF